MRCRVISDGLGVRHVIEEESDEHLVCEIAHGGHTGYFLHLDMAEIDDVIEYCEDVARMLRCLMLVEGDTRSVITMGDPDSEGELMLETR